MSLFGRAGRVKLKGKAAQRYGGGHAEESFPTKQSGIRINKGHGKMKRQRKIGGRGR